MRFTVSGCVAGCVQDASRMRPGCVASADFLEIAKIWAENLKKSEKIAKKPKLLR